MDEKPYETEAKRLLGDPMTYKRLDYDPFPEVVRELNRKLDGARDVGLLNKREFEHLLVGEFNVPTF